MRAINTLQGAFAVPIGWSDHTMGLTADVVAVALGAVAIEKHFTLDRNHSGPDHSFAVEPGELTAMVRAVRDAEASLGSSVKHATEAEAEMYRLGRRSLVIADGLLAGGELTRENLLEKRPGYGIAPHELDHVVGRRVARDMAADEVLTWDDLR